MWNDRSAINAAAALMIIVESSGCGGRVPAITASTIAVSESQSASAFELGAATVRATSALHGACRDDNRHVVIALLGEADRFCEQRQRQRPVGGTWPLAEEPAPGLLAQRQPKLGRQGDAAQHQHERNSGKAHPRPRVHEHGNRRARDVGELEDAARFERSLGHASDAELLRRGRPSPVTRRFHRARSSVRSQRC